MKLASFFAIIACTFVAQASSIPNLLADIAKISVDVNNLNKQVVAFPKSGGSLTTALAIHASVAPAVTDIHTATTDANNVTPLPVSLADGTSVINAINNLKPVIITALNNIVAKKSAFVSLPIAGLSTLIKSDLNSLSTATQAFEAALIAKAPPSLQSSATSLRNAINSAFATAISAYS